MADKRTVSTDALATLGSIISEGEKRDAIHLAVEPCIAVTVLTPGQKIGVTHDSEGLCYSNEHGKAVGIVDPFLSASVKKGQRFWFIMNPRQISSLRHVWEHPDFPEPPTENVEDLKRRISDLENQIEEISCCA